VRYRRVLIPLGRSLQRNAAAPDFFTYPRAVAVFDAGPVKDRLFMAYQEKAGVIEVLSYNEEAGRFEFQLVTNYRQGATPKVERASRKVCTVCHQNQAPLFPRQLWDETNSNPAVLKLLLAERKDFYGFPTEQSADVPYQIDNAIHRANEFSLYQRLWKETPAPDRTAWLRAILVCRLSGACGWTPPAMWRAKWPNGVSLPNPEIPNRNPLAILSRQGPPSRPETLAMLAVRQATIEPIFEPATRRAPLETRPIDNDLAERATYGLASWLSENEATRIDHALRSRPAPIRQYRARCTMSLNEIDCQGDFTLHATDTGDVRALSVGAVPPVAGFTVAKASAARLSDGAAIQRLSIQGSTGVLEIRDDFSQLAAALDKMPQPAVFQRSPIRRAVFTELGLAGE
jgi:hypothetical protein